MDESESFVSNILWAPAVSLLAIHTSEDEITISEESFTSS